MSGVKSLERSSPGLPRLFPAIFGLGLGSGRNFGYNGECMGVAPPPEPSSILRQALDKTGQALRG
ncbi:MAG: hypothetical protein IID61_09925 [SAR324 cluster bacterium]|nr:hypothetical protein [SAR324 cluster bacterium]